MAAPQAGRSGAEPGKRGGSNRRDFRSNDFTNRDLETYALDLPSLGLLLEGSNPWPDAHATLALSTEQQSQPHPWRQRDQSTTLDSTTTPGGGSNRGNNFGLCPSPHFDACQICVEAWPQVRVRPPCRLEWRNAAIMGLLAQADDLSFRRCCAVSASAILVVIDCSARRRGMPIAVGR